MTTTLAAYCMYNTIHNNDVIIDDICMYVTTDQACNVILLYSYMYLIHSFTFCSLQ